MIGLAVATLTVWLLIGAATVAILYTRLRTPSIAAPEPTPPVGPLWASPRPVLPAPATAAARRAQTVGARAEVPVRLPPNAGRAGSPPAIRELLDGMAEVLLMETASAAVRGDDHNAGTLMWLSDFIADARDSIADAG